MNQKEANQKILELMNKEDLLSEKEINLFKESIYQCNLKQQNKYGFTPLIYAFIYNKKQNLNINEEQWDYLIKKSDLKQKDKYGQKALRYALLYNRIQGLNLSEGQWDYLIRNSDLNQKNYIGDTPLMNAFMYNKDQNLNLNQKQWDYLIKNSDLTKEDKDGWTPLLYFLFLNKDQNLKLSSKQFKTMYEDLDEKKKQKTFKKLIQKHVTDDHQYLEEINLFLYELQFQPNKKILSWLKENQHQDILEIIEKRNLFFQLNQTIKEIDNYQKITTIKL